MAILLFESKRDDLLIPYFELVKDKIPELTLGKFKTMMLDKLAAQGRLTNLSLGSNFYLAGATKYYFQGQLTTDGKANILDGDTTTPDNWNNEVCERLNVLINILRNAYIDTVGTTFEQPEDFGTLTLPKLLKKYNKKIQAAVDEKTAKMTKKELTGNRVGNGYTFDILYSYADATKYERATAPGSWCITYGAGHYSCYVTKPEFSKYGGIHYVVFLKDGYENLDRNDFPGEGYTPSKPHDEYGNSMICYLQRNDSWKPTYITSRWNHGYGETHGTEADHAYNLDEFCEITGVTPEELEGIYQIWRKNSGTSVGKAVDAKTMREYTKNIVRRLKYAQMLINTSEDPHNALVSSAGAKLETLLFGDENNSRKNICSYVIKEDDTNFIFFRDRTNIILESLRLENDASIATAGKFWGNREDNNDVIVVYDEKTNMLYSVRYHSFISVGGVYKFKRVRESFNSSSRLVFAEVRMKKDEAALISLINHRPLKLPNGDFWYHYVIGNGISHYEGNSITCLTLSEKSLPNLLQFFYKDEKGSVFYNVSENRFVNLEEKMLEALPKDFGGEYYGGSRVSLMTYNGAMTKPVEDKKNPGTKRFVPSYSIVLNSRSFGQYILDEKLVPVSIYGEVKFGHISIINNRFFSVRTYNGGYNAPDYLYDLVHKKYVGIGDKPIVFRGSHSCENDNLRYYTLTNETYGQGYLLYDGEAGLLLRNPFNHSLYFRMRNSCSSRNGDGGDLRIFKDDFDYYDYWASLPENCDRRALADKELENHVIPIRDMEIEYVPNNLPVNDEYEVVNKNKNNAEVEAVKEPLNESKRDDLLLPYLDILRSKGIDMKLGQFKTYMLDLLSSKGGMHNLSLASNYYLAGATRYYFNGDLTLNKDLSIFKNDPSAVDQWNEEVCKRLDTLIVILRNAYIDTVGTTFEQPEDFGTLSLAKLLRKYNKKIDSELGIVSEKKPKEEEPEEVFDPHVGNGYTYDILYSYADATKYERFTSPGSWCITYGTQHYNYYMRALACHYVIFLKEGYEKLNRADFPGPGFTKEKPHDEYGNSMIAYLQRNDGWGPTYITSRWNHGYGNTSGTEADHAYDINEFMQITGVSEDELKRIYNEWSKKRQKMHREINPEVLELRAEKKGVLRLLKYAQMRLNGGEAPENLFKLTKNILGNQDQNGNLPFKKGIFEAMLLYDEHNSYLKHYRFIIDRGNILFDTLEDVWNSTKRYQAIYSNSNYRINWNEDASYKNSHIKDVLFIRKESGYLAYDLRRRSYITVDGVKAFKYIPENYYSNNTPYVFYPVAMSKTQVALISTANNMPLKMPNGECWMSAYGTNITEGRGWGRSTSFKMVSESDYEIMLCTVYDSSSGEKYFYNLKKRRFSKYLDLSEIGGSERNTNVELVHSGTIRIPKTYGIKRIGYDKKDTLIFNENDERISFFGFDKFVLAKHFDNTNLYYVSFQPNEENLNKITEAGYRMAKPDKIDENFFLFFDDAIKAIPMINGDEIPLIYLNSTKIGGRYACIRIEQPTSSDWRYCYFYYIYDMERHGFLINPTGWPAKYLFDIGYSPAGEPKDWRYRVDRISNDSWSSSNTGRVLRELNPDTLEIDESTMEHANSVPGFIATPNNNPFNREGNAERM